MSPEDEADDFMCRYLEDDDAEARADEAANEWRECDCCPGWAPCINAPVKNNDEENGDDE